MRNVIVILSALVLLLFGCAKEENVVADTASSPRNAPSPAQSVNFLSRTVASGPGVGPALPVATQPQRMIVRTATLTLIVSDAQKSMQAITAQAAQLGGYVTESKEWRENDQLRGTLTVQVPSQRFNDMLGSAKKSAVRVQGESSSGTDVTQEFTDLAARLRNAEAAEVELRELLTTIRQRTQKAAEVLEVYGKLNEVRGEIEQLKGRMLYLSQTSAMSAITFELIPDVLAQPVVETGWRPLAIVHDALHSLTEALQWLASVVIWFVLYVVPIALLFVLITFPLVKLLRRSATTSPASSESHPSHP